MKILVACEYSGKVRDAFIRVGHDAVSCDILPTEKPGPHHQGSVLDILDDGWDMMIAFPPCTHLASSGARWFAEKRADGRQQEGSDFFMRMINAMHLENICKIAEHNPHCNVALWTKRKDIVSRMFAKREKPSNLILIWSNPKIDKVVYTPPKHFDRVFNNVSYEHKPDEQNCTGQKCKDCLLCYRHDTTNVIVEAVKLNGRTIKS